MVQASAKLLKLKRSRSFRMHTPSMTHPSSWLLGGHRLIRNPDLLLPLHGPKLTPNLNPSECSPCVLSRYRQSRKPNPFWHLQKYKQSQNKRLQVWNELLRRTRMMSLHLLPRLYVRRRPSHSLLEMPHHRMIKLSAVKLSQGLWKVPLLTTPKSKSQCGMNLKLLKQLSSNGTRVLLSHSNPFPRESLSKPWSNGQSLRRN